MVSLEEYSKINNLISSCNDMIDGKFILANYKISNILKNITESKEVYNLIANQMNNFNFEREFSKAQLRKEKKFVLPDETEKILPLIFCVLVGFKNKEIDFDSFLKEYYKTEKGRAEEYSNFALEIILPFRNIIAKYFEIPIQDLNKAKPEQNVETKEEKPKSTYNFRDLNQKLHSFINSKKCEENAENLTDIKIKLNDGEEKFKISKNPLEQIKNEGETNMTAENEEIEDAVNKAERFLGEVEIICNDIITELNYDKRVSTSLKEDIIYITNAILSNCEKIDIKNVVALITAYEYMTSSVRSIKFLTKELKNLVIDFYND